MNSHSTLKNSLFTENPKKNLNWLCDSCRRLDCETPLINRV